MDLWVFDNDGTLYDDSVTDEKFMKVLYQYVSELLHIPVTQVPNEVAKWKQKWHTEFSILALMKQHHIDFSEIVQNTYLNINLDECNIVPDASKVSILDSIDSRKVVFSNNPSAFVRYVLSYVGLKTSFSDFIGMEETSFCGKPNPQAYKVVEKRHKGFDRIIFCDDSLENLDTARKLGWTTIWYRPQSLRRATRQDHLTINSFQELEKIL